MTVVPETRSKDIRTVFSILNPPQSRNPPQKVEFASGTAEEVLDWVSEGFVDIAILTPGAFSATIALLTPGEKLDAYRNAKRAGKPRPWDCQYLITRSLLASNNPLASDRRKKNGGFVYEPLCLINKKSLDELRLAFPGKNDEQLVLAAYDAGLVRFVFGDPLSLSSNIVPRAQLCRMGIDADSSCEFSFGLSETLGLLAEKRFVSMGNKIQHRIGFVYDGTLPPETKTENKSPPSDQTLSSRYADAVYDRFFARAIVKIENPLASQFESMRRLNLPPPEEPANLQEAMNRSREKNDLPPPRPQQIDDLPTEVWVVRPDFSDKDLKELKRQLENIPAKALDANNAEPFRDQSIKNLPGSNSELDLLTQRVNKWASDGGVDLKKRENSLEYIFDSMRHAERSSNRDSRLALVLSGGGAKCAYQAGAIKSIESKLKTFQLYRTWNDDPAEADPAPGSPASPDINLVVGTSGGALNAVPVALGLTKSSNNDLCNMWQNTDLTTLGTPYKAVRILLGALIGAGLIFLTWLPTAVFTGCFQVHRHVHRIIHKDNTTITAEQPASVIRHCSRCAEDLTLILRVTCLVAIGAFLVVRTVSPSFVAKWEPKHAVSYYVWFILYEGLLWSFLVLLIATVWREIRRRWKPERLFEVSLWRGLAGVTLVAAVFIIVVVFQESLFSGDAMEALVVKSFESLLNQDLTGTTPEKKIKLGHLIERNIKRDLAVATSRLGAKPPCDLYFYLLGSKDSREPTYGIEGQQLDGKDNSILDCVIASGTIFPFFPSLTIAGLRNSNDDLVLVDGGFSHNTPVEAAARWGATHIIIIEASPEILYGEHRSFGQNLLAAYYHLFAQAQLIDTQSRQELEIYTLRPQEAALDTLDFVPFLIHKAADKGFADANEGRFRKYSRPPQFEE